MQWRDSCSFSVIFNLCDIIEWCYHSKALPFDASSCKSSWCSLIPTASSDVCTMCTPTIKSLKVNGLILECLFLPINKRMWSLRSAIGLTWLPPMTGMRTCLSTMSPYPTLKAQWFFSQSLQSKDESLRISWWHVPKTPGILTILARAR